MRYLADCDMHTLEIEVPDRADLDGVVSAIDLDTGEPVRLNGWLWSFEPLATSLDEQVR